MEYIKHEYIDGQLFLHFDKVNPIVIQDKHLESSNLLIGQIDYKGQVFSIILYRYDSSTADEGNRYHVTNTYGKEIVLTNGWVSDDQSRTNPLFTLVNIVDHSAENGIYAYSLPVNNTVLNELLKPN